MNQSLNVLLVEDDEGHARLTQAALHRAHPQAKVRHVACVAEAVSAMSERQFDVALLDLALPDSRGAATVATIRAACRELPIVVLTSLADEGTALGVLDEGAQDYLAKDQLQPQCLTRSIRYAIHRQQNVSEKERLVEKLEESRRELEKKNRRVSRLYRTAHRFVDNVSHEFRTPLTVIKEYASLIREGLLGPLNDEQRRFLDIVNDRTDDLTHMVDDMLDVSKLEAGILTVYRTNIRLAEITGHIRLGLERRAAIHNVKLDIDIDEDLPPVFCDGEKIGRVVVNLVVNAIKFSGKPGRVSVETKLNPPKHEIAVRVTDNGEGIGPQDLEVIFRRFKQLGPNPRGSTKGFGLGLSIAKELVAMNLGEMSVESTLGKGSTFAFTVPLDEPTEVMRRYLKQLRAHRGGVKTVSLVSVSADSAIDTKAVEDTTAFLSGSLRRHDLLFYRGGGRWLLTLLIAPSDLPAFFKRVQDAAVDSNRNRFGRHLPALELGPTSNWNINTDMNEMIRSMRDKSESVMASTCGEN